MNQMEKLDFYGTIIARRFTSNTVKDDGDRSYLYFGLTGKKISPDAGKLTPNGNIR